MRADADMYTFSPFLCWQKRELLNAPSYTIAMGLRGSGGWNIKDVDLPPCSPRGRLPGESSQPTAEPAQEKEALLASDSQRGVGAAATALLASRSGSRPPAPHLTCGLPRSPGPRDPRIFSQVPHPQKP